MNVSRYSTPDDANAAAAGLLATWLQADGARILVPAAGRTPLELYRLMAQRRMGMGAWKVFVLDEYVGVPMSDPRTCTNLLKRSVAEAWRIPPAHFRGLSSSEEDAWERIRQHEAEIVAAGGIDVLILGLGQNGHLGFNEPGSAADSGARLVELTPVSVEANRQWFDGEYAPARGATLGMRTLLAARRILLLAYGSSKAAAARAMVEGPRTEVCPASLLQGCPAVHVILDHAAASSLPGAG